MPRRLRELLGDQVAEGKPNTREVYKGGRLLGLDEEDINSLLHRSSRSNAKSLFRRYWYAFPLVAIGIFFLLVFLVLYFSWFFSGNPGSPTYPRGTLYGVIGPKDFDKEKSPLKTRNNT